MAQGQYGVDITARRADDLDKQLLTAVAADAAQGIRPLVLDLGCGSGGLAYRLTKAGAVVTAIDIDDYNDDIAARNKVLAPTNTPITFCVSDALQYMQTCPYSYDYAVLQRTLHYVPYQTAYELLCVLRAKVRHHLYLSVTGATSAIGVAHPLGTVPLLERFGRLLSEAAETFSIHAPLLVYQADELMALLTESGWVVEQQWESAFGNHKAVCRPNR